MPTKGKLEALNTIPTGGWSCTLSEDSSDVGPVAFTAANTYYWSSAGNDTVDFAARLKALLDTAGAGTYVVSIGAGEDGTAKLTISVSGGAAAFGLHTFTENSVANSAWRDWIGWAADVTSDVASKVSDNSVKGLWIPNRPFYNTYGATDFGDDVSDARTSVGPDGGTSTLVTQSYERMRLEWDGLSRAKTRIDGETTSGESIQQFYRDCMLANLGAVASAGGPLRFYPDAATDSAFSTGKMVAQDLRRHRPIQLRDRWTGAWNYGFEWIVQ